MEQKSHETINFGGLVRGFFLNNREQNSHGAIKLFWWSTNVDTIVDFLEIFLGNFQHFFGSDFEDQNCVQTVCSSLRLVVVGFSCATTFSPRFLDEIFLSILNDKVIQWKKKLKQT